MHVSTANDVQNETTDDRQIIYELPVELTGNTKTFLKHFITTHTNLEWEKGDLFTYILKFTYIFITW